MRTQAGVPYKASNGLWGCVFHTFVGAPGSERLMNMVTSSGLFDSEDEAHAATNRALDYLEKNDLFPNLCEKF